MDGIPPAVERLIAAAFGGVVGSFLNVCIYRLPRHASIVWPASACPQCGRSLSWYENIPILSFLALRGRCRTCANMISWQYPIVGGTTDRASSWRRGWCLAAR